MTASDLRRTQPAGLYLHIPFCTAKCHYCGFLSAPAAAAERAEYVELLCREIRLRQGEVGGCDTVFFGGGTPSLLTPDQIAQILNEVKACYDLAEDAEITMEANPGTLTEAALEGYRRAGVNRLSMGVQSMDDRALHRLGRRHTVEDVVREVAAARRAGFSNLNLDLIFAIPGSTLEEAERDLNAVIALEPGHISYYSLQLEEGTPFFRAFEEGHLKEVSDALDREMFHRGCEILRRNGYEHYEISNFARGGLRCRHNGKYWSMAEYSGLGLGASSYVNGKRIRNISEMDAYRDALRQERLPWEERHENSLCDDISEAVFTGLRRREGIRYAEILGSREAFFDYFKASEEEIREFARDGLLLLSEEGMRLSERGIDVSNAIMAVFV